MELEIRELDKSYGQIHALKQVSLKLSYGIYGLLGPNGAGKSTFMNILSMLIKADAGEILLDGKRIDADKNAYLQTLGYMPQECCLYEDFTLTENLYYIAALKGIKKKEAKEEVCQLAVKVGLKDVLHKKIKTYSGGMKQRAMFAQSLLGNPQILILDEPTAGLDPQKRIELRNLIARVSKNCIVLIATHVVSDVEFIANQILLMKQGEIITQGTPQELMEQLRGHVIEQEVKETALPQLQEQELISNLHYEGSILYARMIQKQDKAITAHMVHPNLNDVYLYHFGKEGL